MLQGPMSRCRQVLGANWQHGGWVGPPALSGKLGPGTVLGPPNNSWNPAIFLVLFVENEASRGICADDSTACQHTWVASAFASSPSSLVFCVGCSSASSVPLCLSLGRHRVAYLMAWLICVVYVTNTWRCVTVVVTASFENVCDM